MRKLTVLVALILAITAGRTSAQHADINIFLQGGLGLATVGGSNDGEGATTKSLLRPHIGILAEKLMQENLSLQAGFRLAGKGYAVNNRQTEDISFKYTVKLLYLEIPVNVIYRFDEIFVGGGPYLAYGLSANARWKGTEAGAGTIEELDEKSKLAFGGDEENDDLKPFDFGLNLLAGYQLNENMSLNANYGLGLADFGHYESAIKNRIFSISFNYRLK